MPTEKAHGLQIVKTCEALAEKGQEVELVVPYRGRGDPFKFYNVKRNFRINFLPSIDLLKYRFLDPLNFYILTLSFSLSSFFYMLNKKGTVLTRDSNIVFLFGLLGRKIVYEAHNFPNKGVDLWMQKNFLKKTKLVVISKGLKKAYGKIGIMGEVVHDAVDLEEIKTQEKKKRENLIVYVGHLYKEKGADTFIEAMRLLKNEKALVVGGTKEEIRRIKKKAPKNVEIMGFIPYSQIKKYLEMADILVIPNSAKNKQMSEYTSPLKLFEYMASKRLIVASDVPAIREIVGEDMVYFFEPDNPRSLAETIEKALRAKDYQKKVQTAYEKVKEYTWGKRAGKIIDIIFQSSEK